jgi:hypothetical protein
MSLMLVLSVASIAISLCTLGWIVRSERRARQRSLGLGRALADRVTSLASSASADLPASSIRRCPSEDF